MKPCSPCGRAVAGPLARTGSWRVWGIPRPSRSPCVESVGLALSGCRLRRRTFQRPREAGWTQAAACSRAAVGAAVPHRQVGRAGGGWASESCGRGGSGSGVIGASPSARSSCGRPHLPQAKPTARPAADPGPPQTQVPPGRPCMEEQVGAPRPIQLCCSLGKTRRQHVLAGSGGAWWGEGAPLLS